MKAKVTKNSGHTEPSIGFDIKNGDLHRADRRVENGIKFIFSFAKDGQKYYNAFALKYQF
jgi:hypothetical protein